MAAGILCSATPQSDPLYTFDATVLLAANPTWTMKGRGSDKRPLATGKAEI